VVEVEVVVVVVELMLYQSTEYQDQLWTAQHQV
jgi:hypothetical protein